MPVFWFEDVAVEADVEVAAEEVVEVVVVINPVGLALAMGSVSVSVS
jgi:hypothetical protein